MIRYYPDLIQGSDEWLAARCGLLTASEMHLILTPTLQIASNDKERAHLYELLAQRITKHVEPHYISDDMLRGHEDEMEAKIIYSEKYAPVEGMGFITNDKWGFTLGCSPDGLVGNDGLIEAKSRRQKYQMATLIECVIEGAIPREYILQVQTALLVSERDWCDFLSFSGGLHMPVIRAWPDEKIQEAILDAAAAFEARVREKMDKYAEVLTSGLRLVATERRIYEEIMV